MSDHARHWTLDPAVDFLNHGSFGATPRVVLEAQRALQAELEREPVRFLGRTLEARLDAARAALAMFVGAQPDDLAFVSNATQGVNAVLRSLDFAPGDEIVVLDQGYNACLNCARHVAERAGARVVEVSVPFPLSSDDEIVEAVLCVVGPHTRLLLLDHVTSPTALVLPAGRIVRLLAERGVDTLVDGAHVPGMLPLDVDALGAAYYTANLHKWVCAPKGAAFLHVWRDRQASIHPTSISHGRNSARADRSRFRLEFDWVGTDDPTAFLCVPEALSFMASLVPGGWDEVRRLNHELALLARRTLCSRLGVALPCPEQLLGSMAAVPLPHDSPEPDAGPGSNDPLGEILFREHRIEVPVIPWPRAPKRVVRISAQLYNQPSQYERLADVLEREGRR